VFLVVKDRHHQACGLMSFLENRDQGEFAEIVPVSASRGEVSRNYCGRWSAICGAAAIHAEDDLTDRDDVFSRRADRRKTVPPPRRRTS